MSFPRYPSYQESNFDLLGPVPAHWSVHRLKEIAHLITKKADMDSAPVALENVESWTGQYVSTEANYESGGIAFESGDILFGKLRPYLAKVYLADRGGRAVGDFFVIRPARRIEPRFLWYVLINPHCIDLIDGSTQGAKMPRAKWGFLGSLPIPVPTADEQKAIVTFLRRETTKIDALIDEQERMIELLQEKRQAVISMAVSKGLHQGVPMRPSGIEWQGDVPAHWESRRLSEICDFEPGKAHEPYVSEAGEFVCVNSRFVSTEGKSRKLCAINLTPAIRGDILMVMSDLPNGRALAKAFLVDDGGPYAVNQRVCILRAKRDCAGYLFHLLNRNPHLLSFDDGANQTHLPNSAFTQMRLFMPPYSEQIAIVESLERVTTRIDQLKSTAETMIGLMKERRSALISAAVSGQIDVRGLVDQEAA